jgi:microcystin-dependent protein
MTEPFIGQVQTFGFNFAPRGWSLCNGQILSINQNEALFSLLGTTYGGDGRSTFGLPDLRGRAYVGVGSGPGLAPIRWGQKSGRDYATLNATNMPQHKHNINVTSDAADAEDPNGKYLAATSEATYNSTTDNTTMNAAGAMTNNGGGQQFNIENPLHGIYMSIAMTGVYPSRS